MNNSGNPEAIALLADECVRLYETAPVDRGRRRRRRRHSGRFRITYISYDLFILVIGFSFCWRQDWRHEWIKEQNVSFDS